MLKRLCTGLALALLAMAPAAAQQRISSSPSGGNSQSGTSDTSTKQQKSEWQQALGKVYCWEVTDPMGLRLRVPVDTLMENYCQSVAIPSLRYGIASAITGNLGAEGIPMIYFDRKPEHQQFFFLNSLGNYLPAVERTRFFNNRIPMMLVSYNTGGGRESAQDWLRATFNGNINKRAQVGAHMDYLYSKGSYDMQADKHFNWGLNGSYLGDHYQVMALFNQFNSLNKESGGITDDLYILDPAAVQGGATTVNRKSIPTNLQDAHSHVIGTQVWMNNRYRLGFYKTDEDSTKVFTPVSDAFWTFEFDRGEHRFVDKAANDDSFFNDTYFTTGNTYDRTVYWTIKNTIGVSLLEGFNKWAKAGLSAYVQHQFTRYDQAPYESTETTQIPFPLKKTDNSLYIGGRLAKDQGRILRYSAHGKVGMIGERAGDLELRGDLNLRFRLLKDTVGLHAYAEFTNLEPSYFLKKYVSNHFIWDNDFGKTRRLQFGGELNIPHTRTRLSVGLENVQNLIYFGEDSRPVQHSGSVQVFSATLHQDFKFGILNWQNQLTYQKSANSDVLDLPDFSVYSNLFLLFRIATLRVQFGVDCNWTTRYWAMGYQPATMSFHNQREVKVGNYPMCDLYLNMKLSKVRFYVLLSHINQGLFGGENYFSAAHYPLNPRRFLIGLSVDFAN